MDEKQKQWTDRHIAIMRQQIEDNLPLTDAQWDKVIETMSKIIALSKNNKEVRSALFDFIEKYDV